METSVKERIKQFIAAEKISQKDFENRIGASNGYVNSISKSIGANYMVAINREFPNLNVTWLLTGEGEMLNAASVAAAATGEAGLEARTAALEREVAALREETAALRAMLAAATEREGRLLSIIDRLTTPAEKMTIPGYTPENSPSKKLTEA